MSVENQSNTVFIHPLADVEAGARLGRGTKVWRFSHVMATAVIGENCSLGQNVFVADWVVLGKGVKVQNNVSIYTGVHCEDDVFLGPSMVFTNVLVPRAFVNQKQEFQKTLVKHGATVGANATIVCGVTIGQYALVGAGAVITEDVPDFAMVIGVPAKQIGYVSRVGERLDFDKNSLAKCPKTSEIYQRKGKTVRLVS